MNTTNFLFQKISKKEAASIIFGKLSEAMEEFRPLMKKKKFDGKVNKATKLFANDIARATSKSKLKTRKVTPETGV